MNYEILVADIKNLRVYDFLKNGETKEELLKKAIERQKEEIESWDKNRKQYPCEQFENYYKQAINKEYQVMTHNDYKKLEKEYYINKPIAETTEENFYDMLNVLPPIKWVTINNIEMFCMSEMYTGVYTSQYAYDKINNKYYTKMVDITDKNTWIHNYL